MVCMTKQAPEKMAAAVADEIRVEMARQRRSNHDLAVKLGVTDHTAGRRINGDIPFNTIDLAIVAEWLEVELGERVARAKGNAQAERTEAVAA